MSERKDPPFDLTLRPPAVAELPAASALCLRSKAHWGYDDAFLDACRRELTIAQTDLSSTKVVLAVSGKALLGIAQLSFTGQEAEIDKLFVEPDFIGKGIGRKLFDWAVDTARTFGAQVLLVTADPYAVPFYEKMGFEQTGEEPSGSILGRALPVYRLRL
ncbi:MAG: GNAT family N-acetyltransferase [Pseudomonadota bacterium]